MSLSNLLESNRIPDESPKMVRCPKCGKKVWLTQAHDDYVHRNCATKWRIFEGDRKEVFKHELLGKGLLLSGMNTYPKSSSKKNNLIDRSERDDYYFRV